MPCPSGAVEERGAGGHQGVLVPVPRVCRTSGVLGHRGGCEGGAGHGLSCLGDGSDPCGSRSVGPTDAPPPVIIDTGATWPNVAYDALASP